MFLFIGPEFQLRNINYTNKNMDAFYVSGTTI